MLRDARQHIDDYIAFLISFVVIAAHWRLHHRIFRYVRVATKAIIRLNIYWLLLIVLTPFTTKLLSIGHMNCCALARTRRLRRYSLRSLR